MLELRGLPPGQGELSQSPYTLKSIAWLHAMGVEWQLNTYADVRKQPFGKLPVLVDGDTVISDSNEISRYLERKTGSQLDDGLSPIEARLSKALCRMAECHMYFLCVWNRWSSDANFAAIKPGLEKIAPFPMSKFLPSIIRRSALSQVTKQGLGGVSDAIRLVQMNENLDLIEEQLGDQEFLFGAKPRAADLSVGPMLLILLSCADLTPLRAALTDRPALVAYAARFKAQALPSKDALKLTAKPGA